MADINQILQTKANLYTPNARVDETNLVGFNGNPSLIVEDPGLTVGERALLNAGVTSLYCNNDGTYYVKTPTGWEELGGTGGSFSGDNIVLETLDSNWRIINDDPYLRFQRRLNDGTDSWRTYATMGSSISTDGIVLTRPYQVSYDLANTLDSDELPDLAEVITLSGVEENIVYGNSRKQTILNTQRGTDVKVAHALTDQREIENRPLNDKVMRIDRTDGADPALAEISYVADINFSAGEIGYIRFLEIGFDVIATSRDGEANPDDQVVPIRIAVETPEGQLIQENVSEINLDAGVKNSFAFKQGFDFYRINPVYEERQDARVIIKLKVQKGEWVELKADIEFMQSQGKKVYFSVGGATYYAGLPTLEAEGEDIINGTAPTGITTPTIYALNQILQYTGADGLDVDWEQTELNGLVVDDSMYWRLYTFTRALRAACDFGPGGFKLGIASFSTSWDQTATIQANAQTIKGISGDATSTLNGWYGGNAGQARGAAKFEYNGTTYSDWLDWLDFIYIMSYDVGQDGYHDSAGRPPEDPNFNTGGHNTTDNDHYSAIQAHKECVYVLEAMGKTDIPVSIGLEPSPEGAGKATLMVRDSHCNSGAAIMVKDQYQRVINMPHSVENYATYIESLTSRPNDGYMVWSLWKNDYSPVVARLPNTNPIEDYANDTNLLAEITRVRGL